MQNLPLILWNLVRFKGSLHTILHNGFWKSEHDFLIAIPINFIFAMHGFRDNDVLMQAEYNVIVISPPGGATRNFLMADSERATLSFHVQLTLFVYLERFRRYSIFCIWLGFPYILGDELVGFFGQNNPQNVKWVKNTCWEGTSELTRLDCIFYVFVLFLYLNLECEELSDYASKMPDTSDNTLRDFFFFLQSRSTSYTNATEALSRLFAANSHSANHPDVHNPILTVVI